MYLCCQADTVASHLTDEQKAKIVEHRKVCKEQVGNVDQKLIDNARKGDISDDSQLKKYLACLAVRIGFITEANEISLDVLKAKAGAASGNQELANKTADECAKEKKDNYEDTAVALIKCFVEKTHFTVV